MRLPSTGAHLGVQQDLLLPQRSVANLRQQRRAIHKVRRPQVRLQPRPQPRQPRRILTAQSVPCVRNRQQVQCGLAVVGLCFLGMVCWRRQPAPNQSTSVASLNQVVRLTAACRWHTPHCCTLAYPVAPRPPDDVCTCLAASRWRKLRSGSAFMPDSQVQHNSCTPEVHPRPRLGLRHVPQAYTTVCT